MTASNPNLTDIARKAKVSIATVSRALNGSPSVLPATRDRVLAAANDFGYIPDPRFRLMAKSRTSTGACTGNLALLLQGVSQAEFVGNPYYARLFWGIEETASARGFHLILSTLRNGADHYLPDFVRDFKVDGVIALAYSDDDLVRRISDCMPLVMLNRSPGHLPVSVVLPDNASGVRQAMDYLVGLGHRRITYFLIDDRPHENTHRNSNHKARREAFCRYVSDHELNEAQSVVLGERTKGFAETIYDVLAEWLSTGQLPTALLCSTDVYAFEFLKSAAALGIDVPEALSIVGTDDRDLCKFTSPALTSIRQPFEAMGATAVKLLLDRIESPDTPTVRTISSLDVSLIERESCAPPRQTE